MVQSGTGDGRPGDAAGGVDRTDDDALADAILAIYTSAIPVVGRDAEADDEPPDERAGTPADQIERDPTDSPPPAPPSSGGRAWDLEDDRDAPPARVWDLGDLPVTAPFDPPSIAVPEPADPPRGEPWTRLAEPEPGDRPETTDPASYAVPGSGDPALPASWAPPSPDPQAWDAPAWDAPVRVGAASGDARGPDLAGPEAREPVPAEDDDRSSAYDDSGVDPVVLERMQAVLSGETDAVPEVVAPKPYTAPPAEPHPEFPSADRQTRREPTPWFDLSSAPPPDPSTSAPLAPPAGSSVPDAPVPPVDGVVPPVLVEPRATTGPLPTIASLPPGTVRSSPLPAVPGTDAPAVQPGMPERVERMPGVRPVERSGIEPTPRELRAGRAGRLFWLWFAANASLLAVAAGGVLFSLGVSLRQALISALLGVSLSFLPLGVSAFAGRGSGMPSLAISRAAFGVVGNIVPAVLALVSRAIVGGALLWLAGDAVRGAVGGSAAGSSAGVVTVGVLGVLAGVLAVVGYGLLSRILLVLGALTALLVVGLVVLTASRIDLGAALAVPDGPWLLIVSGVVVVVSVVGLAWAQSGGDLARYQTRTGSASGAVVSAAAGAAVPALALLAWGILLAASSPEVARGLAAAPATTVAGLLPAWAVLPFLGTVVVAALAGAAIAGYSGGFAVRAAGIRVPRPAAAAVSAVLVVVAGLGLAAIGAGPRVLIADLLTTLAVPVAAWTGIVGAETMIRQRRLHAPSLLERGGVYPDVRVVNLVTLVLGSAVGWGFTTSTLVGLRWEGFLFAPLGFSRVDPVAQSDVGVLIALGLGLLVPVVTAVGTIRHQEAVRARRPGAALD